MKYNIVYADSSGGVKTASESLFNSFTGHSIKSKLINLDDFDCGFFKKACKSFNFLIKLSKDDVLILQHFYPIFIGLFLRYFGYKKLINVVHTDLVEYYNSISFFKKIIVSLVFFLLRYDVVVFVSKESELKAIDKFKLTNTTTIYNSHSYPNRERVENRFNKNIKLGSISRLHKVKNIDLLIRVFKQVRYKVPSVELLIYGSGDEQEELERYIHQQGCANFVTLLGPSNNKDEMYSSIDALVSFSSIEGLPTAILESIGYDIPVLYTDCSSGPREIMSPSSNPLIKTSSYEKTNVGYLVKPTVGLSNYESKLSEYECEYVDFLILFIKDVEHSNFNMEFDTSRFEEEAIVNQWLSFVSSL